MQEAVSDVAQAASRAGKVADCAASEASGKVPASLGNEMLAGMHALVRVLGESLVAGLSREGLESMKEVLCSEDCSSWQVGSHLKAPDPGRCHVHQDCEALRLQVVENKVHAYVSTHGPKLREISRRAAANGPEAASSSPTSPPVHGDAVRPSYRRGNSAPSKSHNSHSDVQQFIRAPVCARIPGKLQNAEELSVPLAHALQRPHTAGPTMQVHRSTPRKAPADALLHCLAEHSSQQRRVRYAAPWKVTPAVSGTA